MKKLIIMSGAIALIAAGSIFADDYKAKTAASKKGTVKADMPADRTIELRAGPRISFLSGEARQGKTGTIVDVWDDLGLDEPSVGAQIDLDIQPFQSGLFGWKNLDRLHLNFGYTYDKYDHNGSISKAITTDRGDVIQTGSTVNADFDLHTYEIKLGYDLVSNKTWRVQPYVGGKWLDVDGRISASGSAVTAAPASRTVTGTRSASYSNDKETILFGADARAYISRSWYAGGDVSGFGYDEYHYLTGDAYTGYDFSKTWGVRAGYSFDYADYKNKNDSVKLNPLLGAVYVQAVWGF